MSLDRGPLGEVRAGDPRREAQVVFDPRAGSRLAAHGDHLEDQRTQSLRRAVHRGCQPGRSGAHHDQIEAAVRQVLDRQAEVIGQDVRRRAAQNFARDDHDGQVVRADVQLA